MVTTMAKVRDMQLFIVGTMFHLLLSDKLLRIGGVKAPERPRVKFKPKWCELSFTWMSNKYHFIG